MSELLFAYRLLRAPRYEESVLEESLKESLAAQRAMWDSMRFYGGGANDALSFSLHVDYTCRSGQENLLILSGEGFDSCNSQKHGKGIAAYLPADYHWKRDDDLARNLLCQQSKWESFRVSRRVEAVDITPPLPFYPVDTQGSSLPSSDKSPGGASSGRDSAVSEYFSAEWKFPLLDGTVSPTWHALAGEHTAVPMLAALGNAEPCRFHLLSELQRMSPARIRFSVYPVTAKSLLKYREIAIRIHEYLKPHFRALAEAGSLPPAELRRVYERYVLPAERLCVLTIRIAAERPDNACQLAEICAFSLGGASSFQVEKDNPAASIDRALQLAWESKETTVAESRGLHGNLWEQFLKKAPGINYEDLDQQDEEGKRRVQRFLYRMPHVYTSEELAAIVQFPYAGKRGLPGIETYVPPPFAVPFMAMRKCDKGSEDVICLGYPTDLRNAVKDSETDIPDGNASHWHPFPIIDLCKHMLVTGSTGSGKSHAMKYLLRQLKKSNIPFLVIEPVKTEYFPALKNDFPPLRLLHFDKDKKEGEVLAFDPMVIPRGVSTSSHIAYLKACLMAAFPLYDLQDLILENGLHEYYRMLPKSSENISIHNKDVLYARKDNRKKEYVSVFPSLRDFIAFFVREYLPRKMSENVMLTMKVKSDSEQVKETEKLLALRQNQRDRSGASEFWIHTQQAFQRRFDNLLLGPVGYMADAFQKKAKAFFESNEETLCLADFFDRPAVLELDALPDSEDKTLIMAFILSALYAKRQTELDPGKANGMKHLLVVEEAHRLLGNNRSRAGNSERIGLGAQEKAATLFIDMLAEIRAYGQGIAIVEQIPTKIVADAIKNTNLKLIFRTAAGEDRRYLAETMNCTALQQNFMGVLKTGMAIAFEENVDTPLLLTMPVNIYKEEKRV